MALVPLKIYIFHSFIMKSVTTAELFYKPHDAYCLLLCLCIFCCR